MSGLLIFMSLLACASKPQPFLFRASRDWRGILIFGALHRGVLPSEISPVVQTALAGADHAYFESDVLHDLNHSRLRLLIRSGELSLDRRLAPAEFSFLDQAMAKAAPDLTPEKRKLLRPFTALTLLQSTRKVQLDAAEAKGYAPENDSDLALLLEAQNLKTPIAFLTTPMDETCFEEIDRDSLAKIHAIYSGESADADFEQTRALAQAYKTGDLKKVAKATAALENQCWLHARNKADSQFILGQSGLPFVSVDIGQLVSETGQPGLLDLLEQQGFTIQRLSPPKPSQKPH